MMYCVKFWTDYDLVHMLVITSNIVPCRDKLLVHYLHLCCLCLFKSFHMHKGFEYVQ